MVQSPGAAQAAEGALDALAEGGTRQIGPLAAGVGEQRLGIGGAQRGPRFAPGPPQGGRPRQLFRQGPREVGRRRDLFRRAARVGPVGEGMLRMLAAAPAPLAHRADLVGGDAQYPGQRVAPAVELGGAGEHAEQGFLRRILDLFPRQAAGGEAAQQRPQADEHRVERIAVPVRQPFELALQRLARDALHPPRPTRALLRARLLAAERAATRRRVGLAAPTGLAIRGPCRRRRRRERHHQGQPTQLAHHLGLSFPGRPFAPSREIGAKAAGVTAFASGGSQRCSWMPTPLSGEKGLASTRVTREPAAGIRNGSVSTRGEPASRLTKTGVSGLPPTSTFSSVSGSAPGGSQTSIEATAATPGCRAAAGNRAARRWCAPPRGERSSGSDSPWSIQRWTATTTAWPRARKRPGSKRATTAPCASSRRRKKPPRTPSSRSAWKISASARSSSSGRISSRLPTSWTTAGSPYHCASLSASRTTTRHPSGRRRSRR